MSTAWGVSGILCWPQNKTKAIQSHSRERFFLCFARIFWLTSESTNNPVECLCEKILLMQVFAIIGGNLFLNLFFLFFIISWMKMRFIDDRSKPGSRDVKCGFWDNWWPQMKESIQIKWKNNYVGFHLHEFQYTLHFGIKKFV